MAYGTASHGWWCNARTYPTRCQYCGQEVFYFQCDCGSKVFFDSLGQPWPEHRCLEYLTAQYGREFVQRAMEAQMTLPGQATVGRAIDSEYTRVVRERSQAPKPPEYKIVRCVAEEGESVDDVGILREHVGRVNVFKKLNMPPDSQLAVQLLGPLGKGDFAQITIHVGDLSREDVRSFSCFVERVSLRLSRVVKGDVAAFRIRALPIPGRDCVWLCEELRHPIVA